MKKTLVIFLGLFFSLNILAQIGEGGIPPSFAYPQYLKSSKQIISYQAKVNFKASDLIKEDLAVSKNGTPKRIAKTIPVSININTTGDWINLPNGERIWQQTAEAVGAEGLIVGYEDLFIPKGGKLFVYNADKSQILGAYTEKTNGEGGEFSNVILWGDKIIFEYLASTVSDELPRIDVSTLGYVYEKKETLTTALECMVDVNCEEGANWQKQKRGTVHISMAFPDGWYVCSGSIVNNTNEDATPYLLTAHHCFYDTPDYVANFKTAKFYFNYENSTCKPQNNNASKNNVLVGSTMLVNIPITTGSDGLLLKLDNAIPSSFNPYYNGWDASGTTPSSGVILHHPNGIPKIVSTYTKPAVSSNWSSDCPTCRNTHWDIEYAPTKNGHSVTAGGSSGSPMFNSDGLIVGTLTGGGSYCSYPYETDAYGKMSHHWNKMASTSQHMNTYLDPKNSGVTKLKGYDPKDGTGISTEKREETRLSVFPNPITNEFEVNFHLAINSIKIYDTSAQLVAEYQGNELKTLKLSNVNWAKGVYYLVAYTAGGQFMEKVIKN